MLASMMNPARTGPPTEHRPSRGPKALKALTSMSLGKVLVMIAMPCGIRSAPNAPWTTRAMMSMAGLGARPQTAEATVKPVMPRRNSLRWPYLSPRRPPTTSSAPMASA